MSLRIYVFRSVDFGNMTFISIFLFWMVFPCYIPNLTFFTIHVAAEECMIYVLFLGSCGTGQRTRALLADLQGQDGHFSGQCTSLYLSLIHI